MKSGGMAKAGGGNGERKLQIKNTVVSEKYQLKIVPAIVKGGQAAGGKTGLGCCALVWYFNV